MPGWGLPCQGSKGAHAGKIYRAISQRHPDADTLVEPFCGGFAVGHYFSAHGWTVVASDVEPYVVALLRELVAGQVFDGGENERLASRWVSREEFFEAVRNPEECGLPAWAVGLIRVVWSFGNSQTSYIYGKPLEEIKHAGHLLAAEAQPNDGLDHLIPRRVQERIARIPTRTGRRLAVRKASAAAAESVKVLQVLQWKHLEYLDRLAQLKSAERVERIEHVAASRDVSILNRGYEEAFDAVPTGAVVYCDPPYASTAGYASAGEFDNARFWGKAESLSLSGTPVYVSEYSAPEGWESVLSFSRPDMAAASVEKRNYAREHLFTYRPKE